MLLHDDLRASMGIHLANSVVIFDEAHNVIDAVNQIYSADVSYDQLVLAGQCVEEYSKRFQSVLTGKNYYYVNILISVINGLKRSLKVDKKKVASVHSSLNDITNSDKKNPISTAQTAVRQTTASQAGPGPQTEIPEILGANDFLFRCGLDNVNLFKVRRHIVETNLDSKIGGYCDHLAKKRAEAELEQQTHTVNIHSKNQKAKQVYSTGNKATDTCSTSLTGCCSNEKSSVIDIEESIKNTTGGYKQALRSILTLITCLTNADIDGRIAITKNHPDSTVEKNSTSTSSTSTTSASTSSSGSIKFVLLNPSLHFQKVVDQARSVLLLGGTLQPFAYLKSFLFPRVSSEKLRLFACGHVVPSSSVLALASGCGPQGGKFEFTHDTRMQCTTLNELHNSLKLISGNVPHGMVVFFSSYQYMGAVLSIWRSTNILNDLEVNKSLFIEPRLAVDAERVWISYSERAIANHGKGAMLFCVMGGKLSEGINFSDKLARCVVVIGMPYPDGRDPVLQEKLKFATVVEGDDNAGKRLYESMCMRTVNQCIGRSIRHINDYAAVVLLDCRYSHPRVTTQLPMWLSGEVQSCTTFKEVVSKLKEFFLTRTSNEQIVD